MASHQRIFEGVRIIDVTQYLARAGRNPRLFVDLGAEVIKVELPPQWREARDACASARATAARAPAATYFAMHNRGKKCVCVDFKRAAGAAVVKDLARSADVLIENYTPGVLQRYGLGYPDIARGQSQHRHVLGLDLRTRTAPTRNASATTSSRSPPPACCT